MAIEWILGTTGQVVSWYRVARDETGRFVASEHERLDLSVVTVFNSREEARIAAERAGLKTWRYVRL